ncbi:MAG: ABC transporter permease, partial [Deltaproteobacteria bacterium]|nr:ABC transporter permease [Deltaproteobacteria bacterium]
MSWDLFLAKKYLRNPAKRGIRLVLRLAVLGVALGVATLSLTQAVMNGFERVFRESILGFNAHLVVLKDGEMADPVGEEKAIFGQISEEALAATPFLYREVLLVAHGRVKGAVFKGIDPLTFARVYAVKTRRAGGAQVPAKIEELLKG